MLNKFGVAFCSLFLVAVVLSGELLKYIFLVVVVAVGIRVLNYYLKSKTPASQQQYVLPYSAPLNKGSDKKGKKKFKGTPMPTELKRKLENRKIQ